jgi:cytochrome c oxidase cbb3-type subunit IV
MLSGIFTALALASFLAVCVWAFSRHKRLDFEEAAQLPLAEDASAAESVPATSGCGCRAQEGRS